MKATLKNAVTAVITFEAKVLLNRKKPKIIAITGSVGKTSTKDAIYAILKNHVYARKSEKSFNSEIGVPLTILGLHNAWNNPLGWFKNIVDGAFCAFFGAEYPEVLILEMGVDRKGDMKRLTQWIKPDIVVVTRLPDVPAHVEYFSSPQEIIDEKMTLVRALNQDGVFIYNNDDEKLQAYAKQIERQSLGFGRDNQSHVTASAETVLYDGAFPIGLQFELVHIHSSARVSVTGSLGTQHAYNCAAAAAVGTLFDITLEDAAHALEQHTPPPGRMRIIEGIKNTVILDDTYNSSPVASEHAIQTLIGLPASGRKVAVLGDMLELGQYSVTEHERIGELLYPDIDLLVTIGVRARAIGEKAREQGMPHEHVHHFDDISVSLAEISPLLNTGDIVLVKGSQGIRAEKLVALLMKHPEKAEKLLVRQEGAWEKR